MMNGSSEHDRSSCSSPRYLMETSPQHSPREEVCSLRLNGINLHCYYKESKNENTVVKHFFA